MTDAPVAGLRVLYSFPHTVGAPGIATTAVNQVRALVKLGADVTLMCTTTAVHVDGVRVVQTLRVLGRRLPHRALGVRNAYRYHDLRVAHWLQRHPGDADVIHAWPRSCVHTLHTANGLGIAAVREVPSPHTASAFAEAARAAREVGIALPRDHSHFPHRRVLAAEVAEYEAARALMVPSEYARTTFIERGMPVDRIFVHGYGVDLDAFPDPGRRISDEALTIVFVGRGEPNKGLHIALQAWLRSEAHEKGKFLICGRILPAYRAQLSDHLAHPSVREMGFVRDVGSVLRECDALILPSYSEGSALVTYEAQACGCIPLVSTACGAPTRHGVEGFIHDVGDIATLTEQLNMLASDRELRAELSEACRASRSELSWDASARRLANAYVALIAENAGSSRRALPQ
jgi:glycosyltransferase involved in cell wall biosynthesis